MGFQTDRLPILVGFLVCAAVLLLTLTLGRKRKGYVRPIPGLAAVDEAVGRATEMGRPLLFTSGTGEVDRMATLAALSILGTVAKTAAEHDTRLIYPNNDPVVAAVAQEVVKESCLRAGRPEAFQSEDIFFVTKSQFGYAAAVDGIMVRQKPAACLFFGTFEGESLIFAETGNGIGAIQIAGSDSTIQLAFFLVACDYTLIGEELFAASGYLSGDPVIVASLRGQDYLKLAVIGFLLLGALAATLHIADLAKLLGGG